MRSFSFRTAQVLLLLSVLLLTATVFGVTAYRSSKFAVRDLSQQIIDQNSARIIERTENLLQMTLSQDRMATSQLADGRLSSQKPQDMTRYFQHAVRANLDLSYLSFTRESDGSYWHAMRERDGDLSVALLIPEEGKGQILREFAVNEDDSLTPGLVKPQPERNQRQRPYYLAAKEAGKSTWTETYTFIGAEGMLDIPGISRATPVRKDKEFLGVLTADLDLYSLSAYLKGVPLGKSGYAFVVEKRKDGSHRLIAHPKVSILTQDDAEGNATGVNVEDASDPLIAELTKRFSAAEKEAKEDSLFLEVDGENWFGAYRPLVGKDMPPWMVGVVLPEKEMMARIHTMNRKQAELVGFGVVVTLILGVFFARRVTGAFQKVTDEMERIASFNLDEGSAQPASRALITEIREMNRATTTTKQALRSFGRYVPQRLVRNLMKSGQEAKLGANRQTVSILFTDIAGFTPVVESTEPAIVLSALEQYLNRMNEELKKTQGTVSQYMGDAIMAFWNAPLPQPDHALLACRSALAMRDHSRQMVEDADSKGLPKLPTRFGIETGEVMVGNIGADERFSYTCLGDTANTAARLEGLNKAYETEIILGHNAASLVEGMFLLRPLDKVRVKGKEKGALVYELIAELNTVVSDKNRDMGLKRYAVALDHYFNGRFDLAEATFRESHTHLNDPASLIMAERCVALKANPPNNWDGVWVMKTK